MKTLVLLRHGESIWNRTSRFAGWSDVDLSANGSIEARRAGAIMHKHGYAFDIAYVSVLKRAIRTLWLVMSELDLMWVPMYSDWRLNERHCGALQGLNYTESEAKFGQEQVHVWRRSYDIPPPPLDQIDPCLPIADARYAQLSREEIPRTECMKDTVRRVLQLWNDVIAREILANKRVLIVGHCDSLRAIIKYLENISDRDILALNLPTGTPLIYKLTEDLTPISRYYLDDSDHEPSMRSAGWCHSNRMSGRGS